ncbi:hypothetical protein HYS72_00340 [Candidatus Pacearchaeota archaeon]|nr:hypothetical protein [Candidatus Pacearchaeota archaeon]
MQKKELLFLILGIFLISFASAQSYGSSLNLGNIFDSSLIIYGGTFVIFFVFINFLLGRSIFKGDESKTSRVVISLVVSLMSVYGLSTGEFLSGFGTGYVGNFFVGDILPTIITIIFIAGIVFFIWKWGFSNVLMILGALSIIISTTNLVYEKSVFFVLGIIFLVIGLLLKFRRQRKWGRKPGTPPAPGAPPQSRINALIVEAKRFRGWADLQRNPKFYRSWAHFVGKLGGEARIMHNYNVSSRDIRKIVRRYII